MSNTPLARCFKCGDNHRTSECPTAELREQGRQSRASTKRADARQSQFIALQSASIEQLNAIREVAAKNADAVRSAGLRTEEQLGQLSEQLEGLGNTFQVALQDATQKVTAALGQLNDAFVRAHIEQMWTEKCQLDVLVGIEDAIRSPRATEATELLHLAINCLNSDMIPRAIRLLDEAVEKNPTDYRLYVTLGHAFVADNNIDKARDNFLDAIKQARTESLRAQALLLAARAERALERYEEAFEHAAEAADLAPYETPLEVARAAYEAVQIVGCWSRTSEPPREVLEEALKLLYRAVRADAQWFAIAWIDPLIGHVPRCHALLSEIHSATVGAAERIAVAVIDLKNQLAAVDSQGARWAEECLAQIIRDGAKAWETKNFQDLSKIVTNGSVCAQELSSRWDAEVDLRFDALSRRLSSNQQANAGRQAEAAALHRLALEGQLAALKNELAQVKGWMIGKRKDIEERIQQIQLQMPILGLQQSADRRGLAMQSDMQESKGTESLRRQDEAIRELLQWFNDAVGGAKTAPFAAD